MKNLNLLKGLWDDSHEKQTPQRFARYAVMLLMLLTLGVGQMLGTSSTFYLAIDANTMGNGCNNVQFNIKYDGKNNKWALESMEKLDQTYNGKLVYRATYDFPYGGYHNWQWWWDGSWHEGCEWYAGDWNEDLHDGDMFVYGTDWTDYSYDDSYSVYFINKWDWTTPKAYAWNSECDNVGSWPGTTMTSIGKTYEGKDIYKVDFNKRYAKIKFSDDGSNQSGEFDLGTTNAGKMYYWSGSADMWVGFQYDVTLNQQSGSGGTSSIIATCGSAMPGGKTAPTRSGYIFDGYYTSTGGNGTKYYNANMTSAANWPSDGTGPNTLYAKWTPVTWQLQSTGSGSPHGTFTGSGDGPYTLDVTYNSSTMNWGAARFDLNGTSYICNNYTIGTSGKLDLRAANAYTGITGMTNGKSYTFTITYENATWYVQIEEAAAPCTTPTIAWNTTPANGVAGGNMTASVTTNQTSPTITWNSSNTSVATVNSSGVITYVAAGNTRITASYTGDGSTYCSTTASVYQDITVSAAVADAWSLWYWGESETKIGDFTPDGGDSHHLDFELTASNFQTLWLKNNSTQYVATNINANTVTNVTVTESPTGRFRDDATKGYYRFTIYKDGGGAWKLDASPIYRVTYNDNGATSGTAPTDAAGYVSGATVTVKGNTGSLAKTGYDFGGWNLAADGSGTNYTAGSGTFSITANTELFAKWNVQSYTITYKDQGNVAFSGSHVDSPSAHPTTHTYGMATSLNSATKTGYTFGGWFTTSACTGVAVNSLGATAYTANITLYAKWIENMTDVTLAASPAGGGTFTIGGIAATETTAGRTTTRSVTAVPGNGYYLTGTIWSKSNNNITLSSTTTNPTTVTGCGTVSTSSTLTATFKPIWYLKGAFNSWGTTHPFVFTSATSGYVDVELDGNSTFKLYDEQNNQWYGSQYGIEKGVRLSTELWSDNGNDCPITINGLAGTYRFTLDISSGKVVTVTPPTFNQIRFYSARVDGDLTNTYNFENTGSSPWTKSVNLTAGTTYWFKVIEDGTYLGNDGTMTRANCTNWTMSDANNCGITADVTGSYTFSYVPSTDKLTVTYPAAYIVTYGVGTNYTSMGSVSTSPSITSGNYVIAGTEVAFTATPNLGYKFVGWYREAACTNLVSASNPYEQTINANTTLYAKFEYRVLYIHADWLSWGTAQMTQSTVDRAIYTYEIDPLAVKSGTPSTAEGGHHFHFVNTADSPNDHKAYDYYGVQTPTGSGHLVDGDIHLTDPGNATIQFDLTRKSKITITLTLQTIDDATKPTLNIDADPYYTVNTAKGGSGTAGTSVSPASVEARSGANSAEITASINPGYSLVNWTASSANITINSPNSTTTTIRASADGTITANARAHTYTIHFNGHGNTGGGTADQAAVVYDVSTALTANGFTKTGYTFAGWATSEDGEKVYDDEDSVLGLTTTDNGTVNLWAVWTPNNYTVTFDATTNGGTCATESKSVTFDAAYGELPEATHASRQFIGWYTTASDDLTPGTRVTAETIVSTASDHTLYARFESTYEVTVTYKCGEDVLYPSNKVYASASSLAAEISAPEILGYSFVNWTGSNATFGNASSATTTVNASALTTITANYTAVPTVYFKNNLGWDSVFVSFDCSFIDGKQNVPSNKDKPYYAMTQLGSTDVFYCEIPDTYISGTWAWNIAFDNTNYGKTAATSHTGTWSEFYGGECVGRGDFDKNATMYIPYKGDTETRNTATFYKTGCWMKYNSTESGYQVNMNTWVNGAHADSCTVKLTAPIAGGYEFSATISLNEANYGYGFKLYKIYQTNNNDIWYSNKGTITATTDNLPWEFAAKIGDEAVTATTQRCELQTEALGEYTITVSFATGKPMVDVEYPVSVGDWRLVYKDLATWSNGAHTAGWSHPSRVIKAKANAEDIVSFYIAYGSSPSILLQQCTSIDGSGNPVWNAGSAVTIGATATGIYNYKVTQDGSKVATAAFDGAYDGNFYIRTDASDGGWSNYKTSGTNVMTYSEYAKEQENSTYTHYYMRFVNTGTNIKFCIANDYSECISDTLVSDTYTNEWIEAYANVRFMWDHRTNKVSRAYISGSSIVSDRFLVLEGSPKMFNESGQDLTTAGGGKVSGLNDYEMNFGDDQNWIYEATIKAKPGAKALLTAKYNNKIQYFGGSGPAVTDSVTLLGGSDTNKYKIRVVYDFKTNRLIKAFIPDGAIGTDLEIDADLMIIRDHQADAQQITFNEGGALSKVKTVYGALMFNKWTLNNKDRENQEILSLSRYERDLFYISFPFDVKLSEVFGFGTYGKHWILEYYDGKGRAANGFWADSDPNWKFVMPSQRHDFTMKAFEGYILALDLDELTESSLVWNNNVENVYLYFPSTAEVEDIEATNRLVEIDQDGYECKINRPTPDGNRTIKDSYWHCIGVPSFANYNSTLYDIEDEETRTAIDWTNTSMPYLYEWNSTSNTLSVTSSATFSFKATFSYMVQYAGTSIYWSQVNVTPSSVVARERTAPTNTEFRLELQKNGQKDDQTFVRLSDDENVTTGFDFNYDLSKEFNKNKANIYTMVTTIMDDGPSITQTAGNVLPMSEQTTVVPVGIKIASTGDYTFAIPEGTNGVGVTLIDNETGIRTSLSALDYTINLPAGTYNERFVLEISPIRPISTDLENTENRIQNTDVRKVLIDNILYIVKDGVMYDARGARVQ